MGIRRMTPRIYRILLALQLLTVLVAPALADERWREHERHEEWRGEGRHPHDFRGREFHHFDERERVIWVGGRWHHDWHGGRFGWWWDVGGVWYFYPEPVYPYPTYVTSEVFIDPVPPPPVVVIAPPPAPPAVVVAAPPPAPPPQPVAAPPQFWYYCDAAGAYYPYVANCEGPWRQVPATQSR
jgi:hypothetical protein